MELPEGPLESWCAAARTGECNRCGKSCIIRRPNDLSTEEELELKNALYRRTGVLYIYPFEQLTITLSHEEKEILEQHAKQLKIDITLLPKRITINPHTQKIHILDWFIEAQDICPFLKNKNQCSIYEDRPEICKLFPQFPKTDTAKYNEPIQRPYEEIVDFVRTALKAHLKN